MLQGAGGTVHPTRVRSGSFWRTPAHSVVRSVARARENLTGQGTWPTIAQKVARFLRAQPSPLPPGGGCSGPGAGHYMSYAPTRSHPMVWR